MFTRFDKFVIAVVILILAVFLLEVFKRAADFGVALGGRENHALRWTNEAIVQLTQYQRRELVADENHYCHCCEIFSHRLTALTSDKRSGNHVRLRHSNC